MTEIAGCYYMASKFEFPQPFVCRKRKDKHVDS